MAAEVTRRTSIFYLVTGVRFAPKLEDIRTLRGLCPGGHRCGLVKRAIVIVRLQHTFVSPQKTLASQLTEDLTSTQYRWKNGRGGEKKDEDAVV